MFISSLLNKSLTPYKMYYTKKRKKYLMFFLWCCCHISVSTDKSILSDVDCLRIDSYILCSKCTEQNTIFLFVNLMPTLMSVLLSSITNIISRRKIWHHEHDVERNYSLVWSMKLEETCIDWDLVPT